MSHAAPFENCSAVSGDSAVIISSDSSNNVWVSLKEKLMFVRCPNLRSVVKLQWAQCKGVI